MTIACRCDGIPESGRPSPERNEVGMERRIMQIRVVREVDTDADLTDLGTFTDTFDEDAILVSAGEYVRDLPCLDCGLDLAHHPEEPDPDHAWNPDIPERGRAYRFFVPFAGGSTPPSPEYYEYGKQDFARIQSYERQDWCFLGIRAEAVLNVNGICQTIHSGGCWHVESDCNASELAAVEQEELAELRDVLRALGFSTSADLSDHEESNQPEE